MDYLKREAEGANDIDYDKVKARDEDFADKILSNPDEKVNLALDTIFPEEKEKDDLDTTTCEIIKPEDVLIDGGPVPKEAPEKEINHPFFSKLAEMVNDDKMVCKLVDDNDSKSVRAMIEMHQVLANRTADIAFGCEMHNGICAKGLLLEKGCCCTECARFLGYFHTIPMTWLPRLELDWDPEKGFLGPDGCKLPRRFRSGQCLSHHCTHASANTEGLPEHYRRLKMALLNALNKSFI